MTSSDDGTVRMWDMWELRQRTVIKPTLAKPGRVAVSACCWSTDGRLVAGGLVDGTLQLWDVRGAWRAAEEECDCVGGGGRVGGWVGGGRRATGAREWDVRGACAGGTSGVRETTSGGLQVRRE